MRSGRSGVEDWREPRDGASLEEVDNDAEGERRSSWKLSTQLKRSNGANQAEDLDDVEVEIEQEI